MTEPTPAVTTGNNTLSGMTTTLPVTPAVPAPVAVQTPPAPATEDVSTLPEWARTAITKANNEAAAARVKLNEIKPKADQFDVLEQASKTEAQRLTESEAAAKREAQVAREEATRYKAAATHGITAEHFDLLGVGTEEEINARAEKLAALLKSQAGPAPITPAPTRPVSQMTPGATPAGDQSEEDVVMASLFGAGAS